MKSITLELTLGELRVIEYVLRSIARGRSNETVHATRSRSFTSLYRKISDLLKVGSEFDSKSR